jgi:hypothetical protein
VTLLAQVGRPADGDNFKLSLFAGEGADALKTQDEGALQQVGFMGHSAYMWLCIIADRLAACSSRAHRFASAAAGGIADV